MIRRVGAVPALRFAAIDRPRLLRAQEEALQPLTLVFAANGYGKSTFLVQWAMAEASRGLEVRWMRAPEAIDRPELFWCRLREVLEAEAPRASAAGAGKPEAAAAQPKNEDRDAVERLVSALSEPLLLVIDDYQHATSAQLDLEVAELLQLSSHLHLVVSSPRFSVFDGPLVTSRVPVRVIDADELAFDERELSELAALRGIEPSIVPPYVPDMTQGWPSAVSVVLNELERGGTRNDVEAVLVRFAQQLLEDAKSEAAHRLFYLVVLCEQISAEMLVGTAGENPEQAAIALRALEDRGLVRRRWFGTGARYRCHEGFGRFFERAALKQFGEHQARHLRKVHALNLSLDDADAAIVQLMEIREYEPAGRLLVTNFLTVIEPSTRFIEAVRRVPITEIEDSPIFNAALLLRSMTDPQTPPAVLDRMLVRLRESAFNEIASGTSSTLVISLTVLIVAERLRGAGDEVLRLARDLEQRLEHAQDGSLQSMKDSLSFIYSVIALAGLLNGDAEIAERCFERTVQCAVERSNDSEQIRGWSGLALTSVFLGDLACARERIAMAEALVRRSGEQGPQLSWVNRAAAQALLAAQDRDPAALQSALDAVEPILDRIEQGAIFVIAEAQLARSLHGEPQALEVLQRRMPHVNAVFQTSPYLTATLASMRVNMLTYLGGYDAADRIVRRVPHVYPAMLLASARLSLFKGDILKARAEAEALLSQDNANRYKADAALISAVASWESGDVEAAFERLEPAAHSIHGQGASMLLGMVPYQSLRELTLAVCARDDYAQTFEKRALSQLMLVVEGLPENLRAARIEQLSPAELRTLRALRGGRTGAQVAEELFVTQNTVKFHLRSIYRKFGVSTRAAALKRAELCGLFAEPEE